jgi:fluoride ion exporter CrcB/FEX
MFEIPLTRKNIGIKQISRSFTVERFSDQRTRQFCTRCFFNCFTWNFEPKYSLLVAIGFCGSLTTMSSFALESSNLLDNKQFSIFGLNMLTNVLKSTRKVEKRVKT